MQNFIKSLLPFFGKYEIQSVSETLEFFEIKCSFEDSLAGNKEAFKALFEKSSFLDSIRITIVINEDSFSVSSSNLDNIEFWQRLQGLSKDVENEEKAEFSIVITKRIHDNAVINIYDLSKFTDYLFNLSVLDFINAFNEKLIKTNKLFFCSTELKNEFFSVSICFINNLTNKSLYDKDFVNRKARIEKITSISHFSGIQDCMVLPEDFYLIQKSPEFIQLSEKFAKISLILLISVIFDYTFLYADRLDFKLNGYKTFSNRLDVNFIKISSLNEYFNIYQWLLENGSLIDKIGLIRNLISLNIDKSDCYSIDESVFNSIISGYKVYEKQNVKQYIELRNKISDQLISFNEKASKIIENFASGFQKSALAFVSLFSSIVVVRVLTTNNFHDIFTKDATVIAIIFLIASLIYYFVCRWELKAQRVRYVDSYANMKSRNEDLLTKEDINKILNNDSEYQSDLAFIDSKKKQYSNLWIGFIIIFSITVLLLYFNGKFNDLSATQNIVNPNKDSIITLKNSNNVITNDSSKKIKKGAASK